MKRSILIGCVILSVLVSGCSCNKVNKAVSLEKTAVATPTAIKVEEVKSEAKMAEKKKAKTFSIIPAGTKEVTLKSDAGKIDISSAEIKAVYPLFVKPGVLMSITGLSFGEKPAKITIGKVEVTEFLKWEDDIIWLRVPEGIKSGDFVRVGDCEYETPINIVSDGAIKVIWQVDAKKAQDIINKKFAEYGLEEITEFEFPLYIKGQWAKRGESFGNFSSGWDGGYRTPMYNVQGTSIWESESYFMAENFLDKIIYFALEDSNKEKRKLSPYESDAALIIKKDWGAADDIEESDNDPGVKILKESRNYSIEENAIYVVYPIEK